MAAPTIPSSQKKANLSALLARDNKPKVTCKNILCPVNQEWPRVPKLVEDAILAKLAEKLTSVANVFKPTKKSSNEVVKLEKARIRSQLEIGTSCVFRSLERGTLACILVSGQATPAIAVDHIISLGQERGCPLLCLDQLAPTVASATKTKCLPLAIGFKKMEANDHSDFSEIVNLVKENTTVQPPLIAHTQKISQEIDLKGFKTNKNVPLRLDANKEKEILEQLKRVFSDALEVIADKDNVKKKKRNLKDVFKKAYHCQFDIGKRTVINILERGKFEVILVTELILPVLLSETESYSLLSMASKKKCPVIVLSGLADIMRPLCKGVVSIIGIKKLTSFAEGYNNFQPVIEACLLAIKSLSKSALPLSECTEPTTNLETSTSQQTEGLISIQENECKTATNIIKDNTVIDNGIKNVNASIIKSGDDDGDEEIDEDYSYLYIMKKDSKELAEVKNEMNTIAEKTNKLLFSSDYISLSSSEEKSDLKVSKQPRKHKLNTTHISSAAKKGKMCDLNLDITNSSVKETLLAKTNVLSLSSKMSTIGQNVNAETMNKKDGAAGDKNLIIDTASELPLFSICRSGDNSNKDILSKTQQSKDVISADDRHGDNNALGMDKLPLSEEKTKGINYLAFEMTGKAGKKALKHKMKAGDSSFVSFAYTEANIKTMTSNPSKKKKKKKKKTKH